MSAAPPPPLPSLTPALLAESGSLDVMSVVMWSVALIVLLVVGLVWATRLKRKFQAEDDAAPATAAGFTLSDLRAMHRSGQLTDAEFEKAKEKVVLAARKAAEKIPAAGAADPNAPRDSADAIRARRLAREAEEQPGEGDEKADGGENAGGAAPHG